MILSRDEKGIEYHNDEWAFSQRFIEKLFWKISFCSFIFDLRELKLFKSVWTFQTIQLPFSLTNCKQTSCGKPASSRFKEAWAELIWQASKYRRWWVVTSISGDSFRLVPPNYLVDKAYVLRQSWIFFSTKEDHFLMLFQTCTKLTCGLSDLLVITVIALRFGAYFR